MTAPENNTTEHVENTESVEKKVEIKKDSSSRILLTQDTRQASEDQLTEIYESIIYIYGVSVIDDKIVPADDSLKKRNKGLEKFYDELRDDHNLPDGARILTVHSFTDSNRMIHMFVNSDDVPTMVIDDRRGIGNFMFRIAFFSLPDATVNDVTDWFHRWSHDIRS